MLFDHQIPADSLEAAKIHQYMRTFAAEQGIHNYDINEGVCHQVSSKRAGLRPARSWSAPIPIPACTGAVGAFATGIGSTDMGFALKFGALYFKVPQTSGPRFREVFETRRAKRPDPRIAATSGRRGDLPGNRVYRENHGKDGHARANDLLQHGHRDGCESRHRPPRQGDVGVHEGRRKMKPFDLASDKDASYAESGRTMFPISNRRSPSPQRGQGVPVGKSREPTSTRSSSACTNGKVRGSRRGRRSCTNR